MHTKIHPCSILLVLHGNICNLWKYFDDMKTSQRRYGDFREMSIEVFVNHVFLPASVDFLQHLAAEAINRLYESSS